MTLATGQCSDLSHRGPVQRSVLWTQRIPGSVHRQCMRSPFINGDPLQHCSRLPV
ncbi:unnamed protein product, partial [Staurois parvus]